MIRDVQKSDAPAIAEIYNHYIRDSIISFELDEIDAAEVKKRIEKVTAGGFPWIVIENEEGVVEGYSYAGKWRERTAYRFVVESAVYLRPGTEGKGLGRQLYEHLFARLKEAGFKAVIAGVSIPNAASSGIHKAMGFERIGVFPGVGYKFDQWVDVEYWQLELAGWEE